MDIYQFLYLVLAWIIGFAIGYYAKIFHNSRIRESKKTVGELQVIYEEGNKDEPLVFFVSYVEMSELHDNDAVKMIVRVKNM